MPRAGVGHFTYTNTARAACHSGLVDLLCSCFGHGYIKRLVLASARAFWRARRSHALRRVSKACEAEAALWAVLAGMARVFAEWKCSRAGRP
jgi:hypothetical protein